MSGILIKKPLLYLFTLFLICSLNFCLIHLMPGDAMVHLLGEEGYAYLSAQEPETFNKLKDDFGLGGSRTGQYIRYLKRTVKGDWGWTFHYGRPVADIVWQRLGWTLILLVPPIFFSTFAGGAIGAVSGWYSTKKREHLVPVFFLFLYAIPAYCLGILILAAATLTDIFPIGGMMPANAGLLETFQYLALPMTVLTIHATAYKYMIMRNAVRQELFMPYVVTAVSKGLTNRQTLFRHILRNTLPPYISVVALNIGFMVGGALLVEVVFSWQGMGTLIYQAVTSRDYPLLSGALMVISISVLMANFAADLIYALSDPRIRDNAS